MDLSAIGSREFERGSFEDKVRLIIDSNPALAAVSWGDAAALMNADDGVMAALSRHGIPKLGSHHIELSLTGDVQLSAVDADGNTLSRDYQDVIVEGRRYRQMTMTITAPDGTVLDIVEQERGQVIIDAE
jgi:hypothetical protein